jgi:hypothetical protein
MWTLPVLPDTDTVGRVAIVEGYNTNTYQAQDNPNVPLIERHPSPFTGVDAALELRFHGRDGDMTTLVVGGRANHYEPLQREYQSDDGAINAALQSRITIAPRTVLALSEAASVTSFNAAHQIDGTMYAFDPTQVRATYWIEDASCDLTHQLSPNWRIAQSFGVTISGTLQSAPSKLPSGQLTEHRGLDNVMPYMESNLSHDFGKRTSGDLLLHYQYALQEYVLDLTQNPPRNIGPDKQASLQLLAGYSYRWSPEVATVLRGGAVIASAPPRDVDQRPILAPAGQAELYYTRDFFNLVATAGYSWGTINPRLGSGPSATTSVLAVGVPNHRGDWKNFALIGRAQFAYSALIAGADQSGNVQEADLGLYAVGFEGRYALNRWLGVLAGYDLRYATLSQPAASSPEFFQQVFFVGLSGYFSNDGTILPLTTFAAPVVPPA